MQKVPEGYKKTDVGVIPVDWEVKKLGEIAEINMGQSPNSSAYNENGEGIYLIQGNADCKNRKTNPRMWTTEITKECNIGDIILTVRAPVGAVSKSLHNACIGRGVCAIKTKISSEYLYQYLINFEDKWEKYSQGSTFTAITGKELINILLVTPNLLEEQQKIAEILSSVDEQIEVVEAQIDKSKELKKGLMQKLLTGKWTLENGQMVETKEFKKSELGDIPVGWEVKKFKEITEKITDGTHKTPIYTEKGIPFLRVTDIQDRKIDFNKIKYVSIEEHEQLIKRCFPEKGDILYSKNGTIGIPRIVDWDFDFSIFVSLCLIKLKKEYTKIDKEFLAMFLGSENCLKQIELRKKQGTVTNLHLEEIRELLIPIPPKQDQHKIAEILSSVDEQIETKEQKRDKLIELKKGLMQKLLTGKIRVKV